MSKTAGVVCYHCSSMLTGAKYIHPFKGILARVVMKKMREIERERQRRERSTEVKVKGKQRILVDVAFLPHSPSVEKKSQYGKFSTCMTTSPSCVIGFLLQIARLLNIMGQFIGFVLLAYSLTAGRHHLRLRS